MEVWIKHQDTANSEQSRALLLIMRRKKEVFQLINLFSVTNLGKGIIWALFYQPLFVTAAFLYHNTYLTSFSRIMTFLGSDRFGQSYMKTENEGFLKKIRYKYEGNLHSSLLLPPLCSLFLEGKSQQICLDPLKFCFILFLFILVATWIQSFLLIIIMYGVKGIQRKQY